MKLYLVRHTKLDYPAGVCYGQSDIGVNISFEVEKNMIAGKLQNIEFDKIYSSPLKRCAILAESFTNSPEKVIYDERLMELNFGKWEGRTWNEIERSEEAKFWFNDYLNTQCPGGESYADLLRRVQDFINNLRKKDSGKNVLIICHSGTIRAFYTIINKVNPLKAFGLKLDYGQVVEMELKN